MPKITINDLDVMVKTSGYTINQQDITTEFEMMDGSTVSYISKKSRYSVSLKFLCNGAFYSQLDNILLNNNELTVQFTYGGTEHTAIMRKKSCKSVCITLADEEMWEISLSLIECGGDTNVENLFSYTESD